MNLEDISTQLLFTTAPIWAERRDGGLNSGTAFIYNVTVRDKKETIPVLITNHHVVANAKRAIIELVQSDSDKPNPEKRVRVEIDGESLSRGLNQELDISLTPLGPALNQLANTGRPVFFRSITPELVPSAEVLSDFAAMEEIVFIGYPSGLRDETNASPLIRRGITSTPVWNDFQGKPHFLIDAGVFPGSSGSPVFILNQGAYATKTGLVVGNRLFFLGMICQSIIRTEGAKETFLGLGKVLRSAAVKAFIDKTIEPFLSHPPAGQKL